MQEEDFEEIWEPAPYCCIYRVPQYLRKINEEAYTPRLISIGPLHYGRKELMGMKNQKRRYWSEFAQRVNAEKLQEFETYIKNQEQSIRACYSVTSTLPSSEYVTMVLYDAVFIIELLLRKYHYIDDFLLKYPLVISIERDLLLQENQLPYFVLNDLYTKAFPNDERNQSLIVLFLKYFVGSTDFSISAQQLPQVKHFTDFLRLALLEGNFRRLNVFPSTVLSFKHGMSFKDVMYDFPCATKLKKSGLKFRGINGRSWLDIRFVRRYGKWLPWFAANELQIPVIQIDDSSERLFLNMIAFEMFHYPKETHICHYFVLMNHLINTKKDVDLLVERGIIVNYMGDNEEIAKMFNKLGSDIISSDDSCFTDIAEKMKAHYNNPWNRAKATLRSGYFSFAATVIMILTLIQTFCSIKQVI